MNAYGAIFLRTKAFESNSIWTSAGEECGGIQPSSRDQDEMCNLLEVKGPLEQQKQEPVCSNSASPVCFPLSCSLEKYNRVYGTSITALITFPSISSLFIAKMLMAQLGAVMGPGFRKFLTWKWMMESKRVEEPCGHVVKRTGEAVDTPYLVPLHLSEHFLFYCIVFRFCWYLLYLIERCGLFWPLLRCQKMKKARMSSLTAVSNPTAMIRPPWLRKVDKVDVKCDRELKWRHLIFALSFSLQPMLCRTSCTGQLKGVGNIWTLVTSQTADFSDFAQKFTRKMSESMDSRRQTLLKSIMKTRRTKVHV